MDLSDHLELSYWIDAVYSVICASEPHEFELREFCGFWFKELVNGRERRSYFLIS